MRSAYVFPLRLLGFWLLFFAVFRLWFVTWFHGEWSKQNPLSAWLSFWHALPLDISTAAYLMTLPVLMWFAGLSAGLRSYSILIRAISITNVALVGILVLIFGANIFIYEEWHTLLNNRALDYMSTPRALLDSMSLPFKMVSVGLYAGFLWLMWRVYKKVVGTNIFPEKIRRNRLVALPVFAGLLFLGIRGGLGVIPINESAVYYSSHLFNNHAATNTAWNLIHSLIETRSTENHYRFLPPQDALNETNALFGAGAADAGTNFEWFEKSDSGRLNLVFVIMESMTAQVVEELGGEPGVCPNLGRLVREGILFENVYGSGYRTDQGVVSILGGYPAQPDQSIVLLSDKAEKLNSISKTLHSDGYSTAFLYGGELTFANIGVWLTNQRFDRIISEKDFSREDKTQRWGVDDIRLLNRSILEFNQLQEPFFGAAMTLSLHPPYDVPFQSKWNGPDDRAKFLNSAAFADHAIGEFFKSAERQKWYDRTLFVLVADHGVSPPNYYGLDNPKSRRIPLILFGKPLLKTWRGAKIAIYANHHDLPATVLRMMGYPQNGDFPWSRDLWRWQKTGIESGNRLTKERYSGGFAYYTNENGLGWVNPEGKGFYSFGNKNWHLWEGQLDTVSRKQAQSYLQVLYDDFLSK
ncbi:MAG: sulfatase-like hydrolase/transferase [Lewinellaceae bacterium]|nr:sulfatase-like hydrolase/transferase [Lewinellaceae bacterium]